MVCIQKPQKVLGGCRKAAILGVDPNVIFKGKESTQEAGNVRAGVSDIGGVVGYGGILDVSAESSQSTGSVKYETEDVNLNKRLFVFYQLFGRAGL